MPRGKRFPRSVRLLRHPDFERVYERGKRHFSTHMTVFYLQREPSAGVRIGFTVSRVLGGAVQRNRMKRRLREAVRLSLPPVPLPMDIVINPKKALLAAEFSRLQEEVARAFEVIQKQVGKPGTPSA
jgi:ribonuclease P protein component